MAHDDDDEDRTGNRKRRYRRDEDDDAQSGTGAKRAALVVGLLLALVAVGAFAYVAGVRSGRSELPPFAERTLPVGEWDKTPNYWFRVDRVMSLSGRVDVDVSLVNKGAVPMVLEKDEPLSVRGVTTSGKHVPPSAFGRAFIQERLNHEEQATATLHLAGTVDRREDVLLVFTGGPFGNYGHTVLVPRRTH